MVKDQYIENCKTLMKETEDTKKGKIFHAHDQEELTLLLEHRPHYPGQPAEPPQ